MIIDLNPYGALACMTITLTAGGLILAFLRFFRNNKSPLNDKGFVNFTHLNKKLKEFVSNPTCEATQDKFKELLDAHQDSYREELRLTTELIQEGIKTRFDAGIKEIKEEIRNNGT